MKYESMLKRARENIPDHVKKAERFEIPKVLGHLQGNRTVISNFYKIAETLNRKPEHLLKFILKELAAPGELTKSALIIGTRVSASKVNEKIAAYAREFVICRECGRPDTKLEKEGGTLYIHCTACGAMHPVRERI